LMAKAYKQIKKPPKLTVFLVAYFYKTYFLRASSMQKSRYSSFRVKD